ncbi:MAG TPA: fumarylacetoacetate hydrolase family protein [Beijerinckiaceae bacterium]|nr:fumarylacetoacetate hydrolase family protein [Beijerinckiaceae bacterium]
MKFASVRTRNGVQTGLVEGAEIALLPMAFGDLVGLIEGGAERRAEAQRMLDSGKLARVGVADADLAPPIGRFWRDVICTGWNYWDHFDEGVGRREGQEVERPKAPTFFTKGPGAIIGPRDPIAYDPRISTKWDWEAEIVVVIGKTGRSIPASRAMEHVFGYCLANDVSQRELQRRHGGQWLKGKSLDGTCPIGPWVTTADEIDLPKVRLQCFVDGDKRQDAVAAQMAFPLPELISELSFGMTLRAGDILLTGTPSGVGAGRTPPLFLSEGEEVVVRGEGLGELRNRLQRVDLYGESNIVISG